MPICSYLIYPMPEQKQAAEQALVTHPACEIYPADNEDLLILVTDTDSSVTEKELQQFLNTVPHIAGMALTYAHNEEDEYAAAS